MIINEDYFDELEIKDEDIVVDDTLDVEEPEQEHELTLDEFHKLPEQYNQEIIIRIDIVDSTDSDTTFFQTSLIPRITKKLDTIFEMYDIEHSQYVLVSNYDAEDYDTVVKFGNYQLFCKKYNKDSYINDTYIQFYIQVFVNYPKFNYKRAFRFLYTVLNLYKIGEQIGWMNFKPITANDYNIQLNFSFDFYINYIGFYSSKKCDCGTEINLYNELNENYKKYFYKSVFCYFFREGVKVPYELIDRDVPFKPIIPTCGYAAELHNC